MQVCQCLRVCVRVVCVGVDIFKDLIYVQYRYTQISHITSHQYVISCFSVTSPRLIQDRRAIQEHIFVPGVSGFLHVQVHKRINQNSF